ncbi:MAG TPA: hypothetical protein VMU81_27915 [Acetobacteraceae bacterium]|nr:hypothetical protein [Acetobacteraceae bacterium]
METAETAAAPIDGAAEDRQTPPAPRHLTIQPAGMSMAPAITGDVDSQDKS